MKNFTHLHCHTEYSLLDGIIKIRDLCEKAYGLGMNSVTITDHGNMYGAMHLYRECKNFGLKPIIGCECYICRDHNDQAQKDVRNHLILIAKDMSGYRNLIKLSSISYEPEYFYKKPRIDYALLGDHSDGLICLSACLCGEIPRYIINENIDLAIDTLKTLAKIFPNRFYLEIQKNGLKEQEKVNAILQELSMSENIPLVATADCHYLDKCDSKLQEIAICIETNKRLNDTNRLKFVSEELYFKSPERMRLDFLDCPEAIENAIKIAKECNLEIATDHHCFPVYSLPTGMNSTTKLRNLAWSGLREIGLENVQKYRERLEKELSVIEQMGFCDYFLIVWDFIHFAKDNGIPVGPGRGSAAGSLVAHCLGITEIDPLAHGLLFERFLNSERVSLPDIDVDFCEKRRTEVIKYVEEKYGYDKVARIPAFSKFKAKGSIKDVGRVLGIPYEETDKISKMIPDDLNCTLIHAVNSHQELRDFAKENTKEKLFDMASRLEDTVRHVSIHAAGIIISDLPLSERCPTFVIQKNKDIHLIQFDGEMAEKCGLIKFDFLGLSTLTIIQNTLNNIDRSFHNIPDLKNLLLDDHEVYALLSDGKTKGVFQVEGDGITSYLKKLKPTCFADIVAILALYRPGPLNSGMVDTFIRRKHNEEPILYPHESLEECLAETYGVIVYQEQVMEIAKIIAGYSLGEADILRRAMGKKKPDEMAKEKEKFIHGATNNGIANEVANEIFNQMEKFAEYGFNKSHSAAYALLTYRTAWLKVHYPAEYMAALLSNAVTKTEKFTELVEELKSLNIRISCPDINTSEADFTVVNGTILCGLSAIKGLGQKGIEYILSKRNEGNFTTLQNFVTRVKNKSVNENAMRHLINSGAFDFYGKTRRALEKCLTAIKSDNKCEEIITSDCNEYPKSKLLEKEFEALGIYVSGDPLEEIPTYGLTLASCTSLSGNDTAKCIARITKVKKHKTKKGDQMAFLTIQDKTSRASLTVWPKLMRADFKKNAIFKFTVKKNDRPFGDEKMITLICEDAEPIDL